MYPKSKFKKPYLRKMGVSEDKLDEYINSINNSTNLQLLAAQHNEEKQNTDFGKGFAEQYKTDSDRFQYRTINYLPEMEYSYDNFLIFMDARRTLLKTALMKILS